MEPKGSLPQSQVPANCTLSWASSIQSIPPHPTSWRSILILSSHLHLGLPSGLFPSGFPTKTLYTLLLYPPLPHTCYKPRTFHSSWFYNPNNIEWSIQIIKLLIIQFSPLPCYLISIKPKYSPQHPILKHSQSTFLLQCEWPSFAPIQNNMQNYSSVYRNV